MKRAMAAILPWIMMGMGAVTALKFHNSSGAQAWLVGAIIVARINVMEWGE